ncbi:hypothetical protein [Paraglaciecola arctica]|uniref:hypothetical protein n=1 Tax=Paraglaciecola arctica TaxID=1128911 RepID=UPI001C0667BE|nr:hypothetical protein [Paraglaciecola arctica]
MASFKILRQLILICLVTSFCSFAEESIPEPLKHWQTWVLKDYQNLSCPFINQTEYNNLNNHLCAWPNVMDIKVDQQGAEFRQSWKVFSKTEIPLLGNQKYWPHEVKVNGENIVVLQQKNRPVITLEKGTHLVTGKLSWQQMPASISLPSEVALVNMSINGQPINFPKVENNQLWFQESTQGQAEQESLNMRVVRKITDGPYLQLKTIIAIDVSGKMREVALGQVLPKKFELAGIQSDIPTYLDALGVLHSKVKPGRWQIIVNAYSLPTNIEWQRPPQTHNWPKDEVWAFESDEKLRFGKLSGARVIDSGQVDMPKSWYNYPAYLLTEKDTLRYDIVHRGKPLHLENQLTLNRTMWVSFDNAVYSFKDQISGTMVQDWRLSMLQPFKLEAAQDQDGAVLITSLTADERGIENRYPQVNVKASGVVNATSTLPVSGWKNDFERVSIKVNLPPGNKLFAVFGADNVSDSWWSSWSIWASFIVLLASLAAFRLAGVVPGVLTALMLLAVYQENHAPVIVMLNLLVAMAVKKHQPFEKLNSIAKMYWGASAALVAASVLLFSATQLRTVIHPQLETGNHTMYHHSAENNVSQAANIQTRSEESVRKMRVREPQVEADMVMVSGSKVRQADSFMERYQSDSLLQAGSGMPDWSWNQYSISWNSPVAQGQSFELIILSQLSYKILKVIGIILMLLWLLFLLKDAITPTINQFKHKSSAALVVMLFMMPLFTPSAEATSFPSQAMLQELQARLLEAPECAPNCASINSVNVVASNSQLTLQLVVHADSHTAIALPRSEFWQGQSYVVNDKAVTGVYRHNNWLYVPVSKGISRLDITGRLIPVDNFQLRFNEQPKRIVIQDSDNWEIVGTQGNVLSGNTLEFLAKINAQQTDSPTSTRFKQQPFAKVTRVVTLDKIWTVKTKVERIAPTSGSVNIQVPILPGERVISDQITVADNQVAVTIAAGERTFSWRSTLERNTAMQFVAADNKNIIEQWQIVISPAWHLSLKGLPLIMEPQSALDYFSYSFYPYGGESLELEVSRPEAVQGEALAIDSVNLKIDQGSRTSKLELDFNYRSTRGGEHIIELPENYQLKEVKTDGNLINLQPESKQLAIPISPGTHHIQISMRSNEESALLFSPPQINLHAPSSNITTQVNVSKQRWILWAKGPLLGPAILYWGELLAFVCIALLLARVKFSPLNTVQWLILGLGLSLNNWGVLVLIALWFAAVTASRFRPKNTEYVMFNLSQLVLYGFSAIAIMSLISVVPISLLSNPSMGIEGYQSYGNTLTWFADRAEGSLPKVTILSISVWFYKAIMLVWVLWLSTSILSWIKWAWKIIGTYGYWRSSPTKKTTTAKSKEVENKIE